jgi:hypothetical protein
MDDSPADGISGFTLHTLILLEDFKAILGIDDRDDALCCFCLTTATYTIEHYCRRGLVERRRFERLGYTGDLFLPLGEYPVHEMLALYALYDMAEPGLVEPELYSLLPEPEGEDQAVEDIPHVLRLSPALGQLPGLVAFKAVYWAGYGCGDAGPYGVPADLASACLELAAWNISRYRGRRIGMTGNVRGKGQDGEHLESSMPENVRLLLEPYKRRMV